MRVLVLCTGNSCRSQMAEAFLRAFDPHLEVHSAGTFPAGSVNPRTIAVMQERGISLTGAAPKGVRQFLDTAFDYVVTVCDDAREACPVFTGIVGRTLHRGFPDPAAAVGTESEVMEVYRRVRDEIEVWSREFVRLTATSSGRR